MALAVILAHLAAFWGESGGTVAFQRTGLGGTASIFVVDVETRLTFQLTRSRQMERFPSWSPDGEALVVQAFRPEQGATETLYRIPFSARTRYAPILPEGTLGMQPAWSPDGCCVAFSAYDSATYSNNVHVVRLADGLVWNAAPVAGLTQFAPAWSPDGDALAVAAGPVDGYLEQRIVVFDVDTVAGRATGRRGVPQMLTVTPRGGYVTPGWSPDGTWLVFKRVLHVGTPGQLYTAPRPVAELDGWLRPPLGAVPAEPLASYPVVSPDGEWIVYSGSDSRDRNSTVLYISRNDGTDLRQLTFPGDEAVQDTAPAWRPVRSTR